MALDPGRRRTGRLVAAPAAAFLLALPACSERQSALDPGADHAAAIFNLSLVLIVGAAVIFAGVMALALYAVFVRPERFPGARGWVIGGGILFPVVALSALQVHEFGIARRLSAATGPDTLRVEVTGYMWWWDVRYPGAGPAGGIRTANQIHIPVGRPVEFVVRSADVIHSFWVPSLAGKIDMIPGHVNRLTLTAGRPGIYRGQCAEYCGAQHALMALHVIAEPAERFDAWLAAQAQPAPEPAGPVLAAGHDAFLRFGCGACHRIAGTRALGVLGPDLTHVGDRLSLAAGTLPNTAEAFAVWIGNTQHVKPEARMPSFDVMDGETLRSLAAWLESLK
ncbi:MAG TPA: cytochrome c oxidase subunit II [Azospirillum sp.]|nr:cytochrome c oxidase subunit II [Azospirillum sp.]